MLTHTPAARSDAIRPATAAALRTTTAFAAPKPDHAGGRNPLDQSMQLMGATMSYPRNTEIVGENEPVDYLYWVVSGSMRTYKILSDGRRQIGGFYLPGEVFGPRIHRRTYHVGGGDHRRQGAGDQA